MIRAKRLDGEIVPYRMLRPGDLFQAVVKDTVVHPLTLEPAPSIYALVVDGPFPAPPIGWSVMIATGSLDEVRYGAH